MESRFSSDRMTCDRMLRAIAEPIAEAASTITENELAVSLLTQAGDLQARQPDADFVIVDPSYCVGDYDDADKKIAVSIFEKERSTNPNTYPLRKHFSSRIYFALAELIKQRYLYYAHPIWNENFQPAFITRLTRNGLDLATNPMNLRTLFPLPRPDLCFVIMSFSSDKRLADYYRFGIKSAIEEAGYECVRVDEVEHNRKITDLLLQQIKLSRFIVADLTEARPNCYYELGWAHHAEKDVILTIHSSTPIHFDIKDYNFIVYESASELHDRLLKRIENTVGIRNGLT